MKKIGWPGKGWKAACHRCGFWFPSTELKKEWTGLLVCEKDFEARHPQTLIKVHGEKAFPEFVSKDGPDSFVAVCDAYSILPMADFGTADCMIVGIESTFDPYFFNRSSVAAWAIAGVAIAGNP
jgi:hypothetical protein